MTGHQPESQSSKSLHPANPFSTRAVRPGAMEYQFPPDDSLAKLLARLRDNHWWGEIVGPHGSGKSTLLQTLRQALLNAGRKVHQFTLTSGERRLPAAAHDMSNWDDKTQVVIDGFEQLGWWQRRSLKRARRAPTAPTPGSGRTTEKGNPNCRPRRGPPVAAKARLCHPNPYHRSRASWWLPVSLRERLPAEDAGGGAVEIARTLKGVLNILV